MTRPDHRDVWRRRVAAAAPTASDDFIEELTDHLLARRQDVLTRGGSDADADRAAQAELRSWPGVTPPARPTRSHPWVGMALDWRGAVRVLRWRPSFALSAVLLLTVAVAAAAAATAVVYGILGRPLPYPDSDRLVTLWERSVQNGTGQMSYPDARDLAATGAFDTTAVFVGGVGTFTGGASVERVKALFTDPAMLTLLGAQPFKGRLYDAGDRGHARVVISHRLWRQQFDGTDDIIGRQFRLSGTLVTIVGVLAPGFDFEVPVARTFLLSDHDVWQLFDGPGAFETRRDVSNYQVLARLAPGVSVDQARSAADAMARRLSAAHPATNRDREFVVLPLHEIVTDAARPALRLAGIAAVLLVVAALANLGGLALARTRARREELGVRRALGASPLHLARMFVTEQIPLAVGATIAGLLAGSLVTYALASSSQVRLPRPDAVIFDAPAIAAGLAVGAVGLLVLALPLLVQTFGGRNAAASGRVVGHASRRGHRVLVVTEVALALLLCVTAAAVSTTLWRLTHADAGFDPAGRLTLRTTAFAADHPPAPRC